MVQQVSLSLIVPVAVWNDDRLGCRVDLRDMGEWSGEIAKQRDSCSYMSS